MFDGEPTRVYDLLARHATARPDAEAAVDGAVRLDYSALSARVDRIARALIAAGVGHGDRVATMVPPSLDFWEQYLATVSIGAIWLGLNPRYQIPEYAHLLGDAEPRLVFARSPWEGRDYAADLRGAGPGVARFVIFGDGSAEIDDFLKTGDAVDTSTLNAARAAVDPEDTAVIVYTSGTTGRPKGAMLSHRAIVRAALINLDWMGDGLGSTVCAAPINHVGALNNVCMNVLAWGGRILFHPRVELAEIGALAERERPTYLVASPTSFVMFRDNPALGLAALGRYKLLVFGGAATPEPLLAPVAATGIRMANVYGQTETVGIVTATDAGASVTTMAETIGRALPGCALRIARADGGEAETGETGEIQVSGPLTMTGYWRNAQATAEAFTADGWLRTGDLGQRRADGNFVFVGRLKEMFKSGGYNVYPVEIENALAEHPAVATAAVLSVSHERFQEVGHAFIALKAGADADEDGIKAFLRPRLANYKIPKSFTFLDAMPLLPSSKIDKQSLRRRLEDV